MITPILGRTGYYGGPENGASMKQKWLNPSSANYDQYTYHMRPKFTTNFAFSDGHVGELHINQTFNHSSGTPAIENGADWKASIEHSDTSLWDYRYE